MNHTELSDDEAGFHTEENWDSPPPSPKDLRGGVIMQ